eukprot:SAG11_NODE_141_length_14934_cov_4.821503_19_plen_46_part_00
MHGTTVQEEVANAPAVIAMPFMWGEPVAPLLEAVGGAINLLLAVR